MKRIPKTIRASKVEVPKYLTFDGNLTKAVEGEANKGHRVTIEAYTGGRMRPKGFKYDVVVDLDGASFSRKSTIFVENHEMARAARIGHSDKQFIAKAGQTVEGKSGPLIYAEGPISSKSEAAAGFIEDSANGFPFQSSIGADIQKANFIPPGKSVKVNGQSFQGPIVHVQKSVIREITVTPLGADAGTVSKLVASAGLLNLGEEQSMNPFEKWLQAMGLDSTTLTEDQKKALQAQFNEMESLKASADKETSKSKKVSKRTPAKNLKGSTDPDPDPDQTGADDDADDDDDDEHLKAHRDRLVEEELRLDRIKAVSVEFEHLEEIKVGKKVFAGISEYKKHAIKSGMDSDQFELVLRRSAVPTMSATPFIHKTYGNVDNDAMVCSILRQSGMQASATNPTTGKKYGYEHLFDEKVLQASHARQYQMNGSINALMDAQIKAAGGYYPGSDRTSQDFLGTVHAAWDKVQASRQIQASGFSTLNLTYVLENVANKAALAAFAATEGVWRQITGRRSLNDFKPAAMYRLDMNGSFRKVAADGELKHISMTDSKYTLQAETYGAMITIDRKTRRNDDLGMVYSQATGLSMLGAQRIEESVFVLLLSNPGSFFSVGNSNLATGGGSALSLTSLETARQSFRNQTANGKPVNVTPTIILVPTSLEITANKLYRDANYVPVGATDAKVFNSNEFVGLYRPVVSPHINNTAVTDQDGKAITGQSSTQWYLMGDPNLPQGSAIAIGFLDGREVPYFDQADTQFSIPGGIQMRSYLDWGVAMHVTQVAYKSAGA